MQENTIGSAQHKIKTINVEVNLLDAWVVQRVELEGKVLRKVLSLAAIIVAGIVIIPLLASYGSDMSGQSKESNVLLEAGLKQKGELDKKAKEVTPSIEFDDMVVQCHKLSGKYLNEVTKVINAAPAQMFFETMQSEVTSGECSIKVAANAANPDVGREFIDKASKGENVTLSKQVSSKQGALSESSIKFDYIKKVEFDK